MLNPKTLPQDVQNRLEDLTNKRPEELIEDEAKFLRARKEYLRPEQEIVFKGVLEGTITPKPNPTVVEFKRQPIDSEKMKMMQLQQMVRDAGIELPTGTLAPRSKKELADILNKHLKLVEE